MSTTNEEFARLIAEWKTQGNFEAKANGISGRRLLGPRPVWALATDVWVGWGERVAGQRTVVVMLFGDDQAGAMLTRDDALWLRDELEKRLAATEKP